MATKDETSDPELPSEETPEGDPIDDILEDETSSRTNRMLRFAKRMMDRRELAEDTKDLLYTVMSTSDKAKTEAVKMVAREVRTYLSELKLKEDMMHLATSYSLEISLHLKPLDSSAGVEPAGGAAVAAEPDGEEE